MNKTILCLIFSTLVSFAYAKSSSELNLAKFNRDSTLRSLEFTSSLIQYPDLNNFYTRNSHFSPPKILRADESQAIPQVYIDNLKKLNLFVFGKELVTLNTCKNCIGYSDDLQHRVFLDFNYLSEVIDKLNKRRRHKFDKELLITFAMAHELAHIINLLHFNEYSCSVSGINNPKINSQYEHLESLPSEIKELSYRTGLDLHAEVDFIALVIIRELGWEYPSGVDKLIEEFYYDAQEFRPRKDTLKDGKKLWDQ